MRFRRKKQLPTPENECRTVERTIRLEDAEKRANVLVQTAELIHSAVARRDKENHWQASVNRMFLGGNP